MLASALLFRLRMRAQLHLLLNAVEDVAINDLQLRDILHGPGIRPVRPNAGLPAHRFHYLARAVVYEFADIEAIAKQTVSALLAAQQGGRFPRPSPWPGYTLRIKPFSDRSNRLACGIFFENALDDLGPFGIDLTQAADKAAALINAIGRPVAIGKAGWRAPLGNAAALSALDIMRKLLALLLVQQPFDRSLERVDLAIAKCE